MQQPIGDAPPGSLPKNFDVLRQAHVAMLTGSLIGGVETGPFGAAYVWSETIPDPTLNFACGVRSAAQCTWAVAAARGRGREPAFLACDAEEAEMLRSLVEPESVFPARWMVVATADAPPLGDGGVIACHAASEPPADFCTVFGELTDDDRIRDHLHRHYLPCLREARCLSIIEPVHLVVYDEAGPAACASLYVQGELAGLYNVSTRSDRQRRGLGAVATAGALSEARARGATEVFLQCPADGFVERFYRRIGFRTVCSPHLICLTAP